ncbi:MAG: DUF4139 domain-containing protein, partial [Abditibacteriota bacterium]|nr:DUF4139 domain-containing protein [Abditibacteriota bacterium]
MLKKICFLSVLFLLAAAAYAQVEVTVYNQGYALVKDVRGVTVKKGIDTVSFADVASRIEPQSVLFKSLSGSFDILEQNYRYDLMNSRTILNKLIGERVILEDGAEGTLISAPGTDNASGAGTIVKKDDGNIVISPKIKETKKIPEGLIARPTLSWLIESGETKSHTCELSYITQGIGWNCDYVLLVNKDDTLGDINGWVTIDNKCGADFKNAQIALIAGDVERPAQPEPVYEVYDMDYAAEAKPMRNDFKEESFFEYHLYKLDRKSDVLNNESKQLALLSANNVRVEKKLTYSPSQRSWWFVRDLDPETAKNGFATRTDVKVEVTMELLNSRENNMGMPLPKGKVKVYKLDSAGSQQFIGEDSIDHTPKDEKADLFLGSAFDVTGTYSMTDFKKPEKNVYMETYKVTLANHKDEDVVVDVYERVWGDWKVVSSDVEHKKIDAQTITFPVKIAADSTAELTYTI